MQASHVLNMDQNQPPHIQNISPLQWSQAQAQTRYGLLHQSYINGPPPPPTPTNGYHNAMYNFSDTYSAPSMLYQQQGAWEPPETPTAIRYTGHSVYAVGPSVYTSHSAPPPLATVSNTTGAVNNSAHVSSTQRQKRRADLEAEDVVVAPRKKAKRRRPPATLSSEAPSRVAVATASTCGVGPSTSQPDLDLSATPVTEMAPSETAQLGLASDAPRASSRATATDVWYFMRPLESKVKPAQWPPLDDHDLPITEHILDARPTGKNITHVGCKLCGP